MPLISVIIPTCNGVNRYVDESIASVLAQTFQDFELIIIDDASTDGTLEYIQGLIPAHHKVIYHQRETNGGPAAARNDGAKRAKGEFLTFLDQDDLWEPTFLYDTTTLSQAIKTDFAAVYTDGHVINATGTVTKYLASIETNIRYDNISSPLSQGQNLPLHGSLLRKSTFEAIKGFDENLRFLEDADLVIRLIQHARVIHLPKPLYSLRRHYGRTACGSTAPELIFASRAYFLEKHTLSCQQNARLKKALKLEWAALYSDMGKHYLSQYQRQKARRFFLQSLQASPFSRRTILRWLRSYAPF